jgi:hypothetical protein
MIGVVHNDAHIGEFHGKINEQFSTTERIMGEFKVPIYFSITYMITKT